jgi:hypothetical protein
LPARIADRTTHPNVPVDRFFRNIRPYFKPYRVGDTVQRGVNAGDFSAADEIDVLLGLCSLDDPFYAAVVSEKIPFVLPTHQPALRELGATGSLLARFETEAATKLTPQLHALVKPHCEILRSRTSDC